MDEGVWDSASGCFQEEARGGEPGCERDEDGDEEWIEFERTPAPATSHRGNMYGAQFWLVPDGRDDVPKSAYSTAGNRGQYVVIVPSHATVIVRRGLDYRKQGFNRWDLTREVLKAINHD